MGYLVIVIGLFFYSFTQVDLSLTLSQWSIWQVVEKFFQHIGYFDRPLSSLIFVVLVLFLYIFYLFFLKKVSKSRIGKREAWALIVITSVILTFSYNAFSYDLFNYIFDAKIVTYYHQSPYLHKALDYAGDPMLSFMHWTHRLYPYGPIWLILTVPLSFIGLQFFLPTFFLFKILISLSFLGTAFFIGKILQKVSPEREIFGIVFFALNPLVVIEGLVSSHNDIVMMFLTVWSLYLIVNIKYVRSIILLILSVGVKFASAFILPIFLLVYLVNGSKKKVNWENVFLATTLMMIIPIILASIRTNFQPWYLLNLLPFAALVSKKYFVFIPSIIISLFSLFQYLPFLYTGNWNRPIPDILMWVTISSIILSIVVSLGYGFFKKTQG